MTDCNVLSLNIPIWPHALRLFTAIFVVVWLARVQVVEVSVTLLLLCREKERSQNFGCMHDKILTDFADYLKVHYNNHISILCSYHGDILVCSPITKYLIFSLTLE